MPDRTAKLSRRERERVRHRTEILDSACQVFSEKGFKNTTIADISKRSEFSIASIYKHFESKEDIYHSIIEDNLQVYYDALEEAVHGIDSPIASIRKCIDTTLGMMAEYRPFLEFLLGDFRFSTEEGDALARKSMDSYTKLVMFFSDLFQKAIEQGEVRDLNPTYLAIGLLGNVFTFTSFWLYFEKMNLDKADREIIPTIFFEKMALD